MTAFSIKTGLQQRFALVPSMIEGPGVPVLSCFSRIPAEDFISIPNRPFVNGICFFVRIPMEECGLYLINESQRFRDLVITVGTRIRRAVRRTAAFFRGNAVVRHGKELFRKLRVLRL